MLYLTLLVPGQAHRAAVMWRSSSRAGGPWLACWAGWSVGLDHARHGRRARHAGLEADVRDRRGAGHRALGVIAAFFLVDEPRQASWLKGQTAKGRSRRAPAAKTTASRRIRCRR
ncbi:hypothetical protein ACTMU2_00935 [Cupriavidus basilensis]